MFKRTKKSLLAIIMLATLLVSSMSVLAHEPNVDAGGRDHNHPVSLTINHRLAPHFTPVEGAVWSLYKITVPADTSWDGRMATFDEAWLGVDPTPAAGPVTTNAYGVAVLVPPTQGVFLARESTPYSPMLAPDFLVSLPNQNPETGEWEYHLEAYPKLHEDPPGGKVINDEFFDEYGDLRIEWEFYLGISYGIGNLRCVNDPGCDCVDCTDEVCVCPCEPYGCCDVFIRITDTMDERLTLDQDSVAVRFYNGDGDTVELEYGVHWNLVYEPTYNRFSVEINRAGRDLLDYEVLQAVAGTLYISFETLVNAVPCPDCLVHDYDCDYCRDATVGSLTNDGEFEFGRYSRFGIPPGERPETTIFSLEAVKQSVQWNTPLEGAVFQLFRYEDIETVGGNRVPIYGAVPLFEVTTGADGIARFHPLIEGIFYLYELEAPTHYTRNPSASRVVIGPDATHQDYDYVVKIQVPNSRNFELPMTGGIGTTLLTIIGALLLTGATVFFVFSKRRRQA